MSTASKKAGLSSGILGLKFMQRGPAVETEKKADKAAPTPTPAQEDAKWEISRDVRESWGLDSEAAQAVTYEESYLPFLTPEYASTSSAPAAAAGGRRSFGRFNKSLEPNAEQEEQTADMLPDSNQAAADNSSSDDELPAARKLVVKPAPLVNEGKTAHRPNALRAIPEKSRKSQERRQERERERDPGLGRGGYDAKRDAEARHPPQPVFMKPRVDVVDVPAGGEGAGRKRRQESEEGERVLESRRAKKPKKKKQDEEE